MFTTINDYANRYGRFTPDDLSFFNSLLKPRKVKKKAIAPAGG